VIIAAGNHDNIVALAALAALAATIAFALWAVSRDRR
jgi:hypothetical protein